MDTTEDFDVRYDAVARHDAALDGLFYYGVTTTGIACRPGCTSRTPRRENVAFFATLDAALGAGFRACKRCAPERSAPCVDERFIALCREIERADDLPSLKMLARICGMSASHVQRRFKAAIGVTPKAYAQSIKRERLRAALKTSASATDALYEAGLSSPSQAYDRANSPLGMTPAQFARGAASVDVSYTVVDSALGKVLIAATARGICRVDIDDDARALESRLFAEFPNAHIAQETSPFDSAASRIVAYLSGEGPWPLLPLDVRGTAFQTRVWDALRRIAPGSTASYAELAQSLGSPKAARAVARACATNTIALLVPCHRIVPQSGGVGGYRWDPARKERLLEIESRLSRD